jgi:hypothetical protein
VPGELKDLATFEAEQFDQLEIHNDNENFNDNENIMEDSNDFSLEEGLD